MYNGKAWDVTFKNGLMGQITVEAANMDEAIRMGVAAYRKRCTMISELTAEQVVASVKPSKKTAFQYV